MDFMSPPLLPEALFPFSLVASYRFEFFFFFSFIITIMANTLDLLVKLEFTKDIYETLITGCTESDSLEGD